MIDCDNPEKEAELDRRWDDLSKKDESTYSKWAISYITVTNSEQNTPKTSQTHKTMYA